MDELKTQKYSWRWKQAKSDDWNSKSEIQSKVTHTAKSKTQQRVFVFGNVHKWNDKISYLLGHSTILGIFVSNWLETFKNSNLLERSNIFEKYF